MTKSFAVGHGYRSRKTGDYYIYAGTRQGFLVFYRPSSYSGYRLTPDEAMSCFDPNNRLEKPSRQELKEAVAWLKGDLVI